mgnify:CR=1 FL=1
MSSNITLFPSILRLTGLEPISAAAFLGVRPRAVYRWLNGGYAPDHVIHKLSDLLERQNDYADQVFNTWKANGQPNPYTVNVSQSDTEAELRGWPNLAAELHALALAQSLLPHIRITLTGELKDRSTDEITSSEESFI